MTLRQRLLKFAYPVYLSLNRILGRHHTVLHAIPGAGAPSIHSLSFRLGDGRALSLSGFRGKKILLVNTASDCIYTSQYKELQQLMVQCANLVVIAFPSNDFQEQEKGSDEEIAAFCERNYGVSFPVAQKGGVLAGAGQQELFRWLTDKQRNGWNTKQPSWNFAKYLVNEAGALTHYFDPAVRPDSPELLRAIAD